MKGTLISADFVKARDNSIRMIEVNTDTVVFNDIIDNEFSWQPLIDFISGSYTELHIISKPELHYNAVANLKDKMESQLPSVTVNETTAGLYDVFPEIPDDSDSKFILRLAYYDSAILDSIYCANSFNALKLMHDNDHTSSIVPFYAVSGSTTYDTLNTASYSENVPNAVQKDKENVNEDVSFHKITDWSSAKSGLTGSKYLQSFEISSESLASNSVWSYRNYSVVYDTSLSQIDLGTTIKYAEFSIPTTSQVDIGSYSSNTQLPTKHYYEFSTSTIKAQKRREGLFDTEHFTSASGVDVAFDETFIGQLLKSFKVPGLPNTDDPMEYLNFEFTGSTWPIGSEVTGSWVSNAPVSYENQEGIVFGLTFSGSDETYYVGPTTSVLAYNSGSDNIKFRAISGMDEDDIYLIDTNNNITDISSNKFILLNEPTGSFTSVNLEPYDNIVIGDTPFFFAYHNFKVPPSDLELKKDIKYVGKSNSGINIYNWRWKDAEKFGYGEYQGVIAQEVPNACVDLGEGFLRVDYSKIDVKFKKLNNE